MNGVNYSFRSCCLTKKCYSGIQSSAEGHRITVRASYGSFRMLEGAPIEGAVILEFPTFEEAEAWYDSPL
jgi:hypothetical protein